MRRNRPSQGVSQGQEPEDPNAACVEYLPTFTINFRQMQVNIPYMEHMGMIQSCPTVDGRKKSDDHQLRLVVYSMIYRRF